MKLSDNTILITGGAGGIGFELARQLQALRNTIIITGRDRARLDQAQAQLPGIHTVQSEASDPAAITALFEKLTREFPSLNVLINNAGIMRKLNLHDRNADLEDLTQEIETNLNGPIRMVKQFLPHLKTKANAAIMNVSSALAFVPLPLSPVYCAAKAGLHSFTLSLRAQLKNTQVRVFELAPPATQTALLKDFHAEELKGVNVMNVVTMVQCAVRGLEKDELEIRPGSSNVLKLMSRVAPQFILNQLSKSVDYMLAQTSNQLESQK